jgi:GT2 family glycosyltransferase
MPGWDLAIIATIDDDKNAGCGVSLVVYPDGTIQSPGQHNPYKSSFFEWIGKVTFADLSHVQKRSIEHFPEIQVPRECDYGYFPVMKRECFEKLGTVVDERYKHYFVDPDIGYRIQALGYKNVYCPTSVLVHHDLGNRNSELIFKRFNMDVGEFAQKWKLSPR